MLFSPLPLRTLPLLLPTRRWCMALAAGAAALATAPLAAGAAALHDNLGMAGLGWYNGMNFTQFSAVRIPVGGAGFSVAEVTLLLSDNGGLGATGTVNLQVCDDGPGGTSPGIACAPFTPAGPISSSLEPVRFTGSYTAPAGQHLWVVAKAAAAGESFRWGTAAGTGDTYYTGDAGASWVSDTSSVLLRITGSGAVPAGPAAIPTLSLPGLLALSLGVAAAGAGWSRRRAARQPAAR
jgi:hypothetical protein